MKRHEGGSRSTEGASESAFLLPAHPQGLSAASELPPLAWALGLDLKEKRLRRRREKLPDFFLGAETAPALGKSSWDWLRPASFCLFFLRKMSLVPLRRKFTAAGDNKGL